MSCNLINTTFKLFTIKHEFAYLQGIFFLLNAEFWSQTRTSLNALRVFYVQLI